MLKKLSNIRRITPLVMSGLLIAATLVAVPRTAHAATCGPPGNTTWEATHLGTFSPSGGGQPSITNANSWGGANTCLTTYGSTSEYAGDFYVASQSATYTGSVLGDPDTGIGCQGGACSGTSAQTGLPDAVSNNPDLHLYVGYDVSDYEAADSIYDEDWNSNFSTECDGGTNPTDNTNLSVYLDANYYGYAAGQATYLKLGLANSNEVTIDGLNWYELNVYHSSGYPTYKVEFALASPYTTGVSNLSMAGFTTWIKNNLSSSYLPSTDCLTESDFGQEIWKDGVGYFQSGLWFTGP